MGSLKVIEQRALEPDFAASQPAVANIVPQDGVLKRLDVYFHGAHSTLITTAQIDGESNIFAAFRVTARRRGLPPIIHDVLVRDHKFITAIMNGSLAEHLNPLADAAAHKGFFSIFYAPPRDRCERYDDWGLDTADLAGPIQIEALYGAVTSIGTGSTAITNRTRISPVVEDRRPTAPAFILSAQQHIIDFVNDQRRQTTLSTANLERLAAIYLRQHDFSAQAAQRVDGLITRFQLDHRGVRRHDDLHDGMKQRTAQFAGHDRADYPDGISMMLLADGFKAEEMLDLSGGDSLVLTSDSVETVPDPITDVTPAASDAVFAVSLGMQLTGRARGLGRRR